MDDIFDNIRNHTPNRERPCSKCGLPRNKDKGAYCKECARIVSYNWRSKKPIKQKLVIPNHEKKCSRCNNFRESYGRYCRECRNQYSREWRQKHPLTPEQRKKDATRSYTKELVKRGKLKKEPCVKCDEIKSEAHHPDYNDPWNVIWLCRKCHMKHHNDVK